MRHLILFLLASLALLQACSPAAESVSYTLPQTPGGRMCAHQCTEARDYCGQSCDLDRRQCVLRIQAQAMSDYDAYTREQFAHHQPLDLNPSDFERQKPCTEEHESCMAACDRPYNSCFQRCGGEANVTSSCQFFCF